jgi:hypothetical protein
VVDFYCRKKSKPFHTLFAQSFKERLYLENVGKRISRNALGKCADMFRTRSELKKFNFRRSFEKVEHACIQSKKRMPKVEPTFSTFDV